MRRMSIREVTDMLQGMEHPQLEEVALAYVLNHAQVCGVAGKEHGGDTGARRRPGGACGR